MKLGCLLKFAAIIIIILGISFYLYKKYGAFVIESGKEKVEEYLSEKIQSSIDELKESLDKDKLQIRLDDLLNEIREKDLSINSNDYNKLVNQINEIIDSNKISLESIQGIEKLLKEYEGRKEN